MNKESTTVKVLADVARVSGITPDQARYWISLLGIETQKAGRNRLLSEHDAAQLEAMANMVAIGRTPQAAAAVLKSAPILPAVPTAVSNNDSNLPAVVAGRFDFLEKAVLAMIEANRQAEEKHRADVALLLEANRLAAERHREQVSALEAKLEAKFDSLTDANAKEIAARQIADDRARSEAKELQKNITWVRSEVAAITRCDEKRRMNDQLKMPPQPVKAWHPTLKPDPLAGKPWWARVWVRVAHPEQLRRQAA